MPGFKHHDTTKEEVDEFLKCTKELEPDKTSSVVLFGGEPLLNMELVRYIYEVGAKYDRSSFHFNVTSNGILLKDKEFAHNLFDMFKDYGKRALGTSLDISYDFQGNALRVYPDGRDSTEDVKMAIEVTDSYLINNKDAFKFRIRCTVQHQNYDKILENSIYSFEKYKSISRIIYTYAYNNMEEHFGKDYFEGYIDKYKPYLLEIARMYDKDICFQTEFCEECGKCSTGVEPIKYRYQTPGSKKDTYLLDGKSGEFNLFHNLVKPIYKEGNIKAERLKEGLEIIRGIVNE
jgi:sulfatase maturation enzyme AslB (radical SAM superfamily)